QLAEATHVDVGDEHQREERDDVAAPVVEPQVIAGQDQEPDCHVMAEAVFAGEEIEELAFGDRFSVPAARHAVLARLPENLLVGDGPGDTRNRDGEDEEHRDLHAETHRVQPPCYRAPAARSIRAASGHAPASVRIVMPGARSYLRSALASISALTIGG